MTFKTFYGIITAALKKEIFMKLFSRENYLKKIRGFYHEDDIIKVITGVRRCGKSSLMHTIADELKNSGVPEQNIIYIDLDMRGNRSIKTVKQLDTVISGKAVSSGKKYLFVDEIQNVSGLKEDKKG